MEPYRMAWDVVRSIRDKIRSGALPLAPERSATPFGGMGTKRPCDGCDESIPPEQIEYEVDVDRRTLRFHDICFAAWHEARPDPTSQSPADSAVVAIQSGTDRVDATCAACHQPIKTADGRYRIGTTQFHIECFDASPLGVVRRLRSSLGRRKTP
jgi:hypothetical protein